MKPGDQKKHYLTKREINIELFNKKCQIPYPGKEWVRNKQIRGNIPKVGQLQTLYTGSWVLNSCQSMHMEGPRTQIASQFQQLHVQCDEPFPNVIDSLTNCKQQQ